jgi:hypothetical protein
MNSRMAEYVPLNSLNPKVQIHRIIIETIQKVPGSNVPVIEQRIVYPNYQRSMADDAVVPLLKLNITE